MPMIRLLALVAILGLTACNTVQGVGRDITSAGQAVENAF
jgi:predicted small secreted protein